ncbi:uncharacterized protein (TIGR00661 family) [Lacibacter cauensis]|uniref:Uncharacterized protein (TIGR00661 family) n=1 Tax=Lacibacter cauensis TaxID=510947 RepID=A0A562SJY9_9BACT|nr:glycosyltransferase family protein [Lacibacter cauensis]TWI81575.1 uncharacterized protein (TIGR00661 family) [Lacibacter cauensis]
MNKSFVFAVQGEGRGHLTQAIATYELLTARGHTVAAVLIGSSKRREIPAFVRERIKAPIITYRSPNFVTCKHNKSIRITSTVLKNLLYWKTFRKSMQLIREVMQQYKPDLLLNFYEPLIGVCSLFKKFDCKIVSIAHQYIYLHPSFSFPKEASKREAYTIKQYTKLTAKGSDHLLALSFYPLTAATQKNITVCPPLLRKDVFQQEVFGGDHILAYLLNSGYMQEIISWHKEHPEVELHCFTDSATVKGRWHYDETLCFHSLDDQKFLHYMANAKALVTTAGFESVCEAMYFGKPVLMVPVQGHFEQWCNSRDAAKAGAGTHAERFNLDVLLDYLPQHQHNTEAFRQWTIQTKQLLLQCFADVLHQPVEELVSEEKQTSLFDLQSILSVNTQLGHS